MSVRDTNRAEAPGRYFKVFFDGVQPDGMGDTVHIPVSELPLAAAAADATRPVYTFLNFCLLHRKKELVYYGVSQVFFFNY